MTVLSVNTWTPADAAEEIDHGHSVKVDFQADNTVELEELYDSDADFNYGSVSGAVVTGDHVELDTVETVEDFESAIVDTDLDTNGWTYLTTEESFMVRDRDTPTNRVAENAANYTESVMSYDTLGASRDSGIASVRWHIPTGGEAYNPMIGIAFNLTGSGSSLRGYSVTWGIGRSVKFRRFTGDGSTAEIYASGGVSTSLDTWYNLKIKWSTSSGTTSVWYKTWADGDSEPGYWTSLSTSTFHPGPGAIGLFFDSDDSCRSAWFDEFTFEDEPAAYESSGTWQSPNIDVSGVGRYSTSRISWTETVPANTVVTVEVRKNSGSWVAVSSGNQVPGFTYDEDMTGDDIDVRVTLETTDTSATPEITDLRIYFDPCNFDDLILEVNGIEASVEDSTLVCWGKQQVSGGVPVEAWNALSAQTDRIWWYESPAAVITATLKYNGSTIDSITFTASGLAWGESVNPWAYWQVDFTPFECGPNLAEWSCYSGEIHSSYDAEWFIIDMGMSVHADGFYYVGHRERNVFPYSFIVGNQQRSVFPYSFLVRGSKRDIFPYSFLVQGPRRDLFPMSYLVGEVSRDLFPMSFLVGNRRRDLFPYSYLVYGVNRNNVLELHVISQETYDALIAEGITLS